MSTNLLRPEVLSAIAAVMSVIAAFLSYRCSLSLKRITEFSLFDEWRQEFTAWGSKVVEVITQAAYECEELDAGNEIAQFTTSNTLDECRVRISALIEIGRFSMLNNLKTRHGMDKSNSRQGYRHDALDPLVASILIIEGHLTKHPSRRKALEENRKEVVAFMQSVLAPAEYNRQLSKMFSRFRPKNDDRTMGGLIAADDHIPLGADALLAGGQSRYGRGYTGKKK